MKIAARKTLYRGVMFRSRLEAKWAAFFDLCGWRWDYEPVDLDRWVPDFVLHGAVRVLVEVKPVWEFSPSVGTKLDSLDERQEILLLGAGPFPAPGFEAVQLGWIREHGTWTDAVIGIWSGSEADSDLYPRGTPGFCSTDLSFGDRMTGRYDGGCWGSATPLARHFSALWNRAATSAQWHP